MLNVGTLSRALDVQDSKSPLRHKRTNELT